MSDQGGFVSTTHEDEENKSSVQVGHALMLMFTVGLLIMTSFRTWDFISQAMPAAWGAMGQIIAWFGLLALDIGTIIWLYLWIRVSVSPLQDMLEMSMFVLDALGVFAANILDSAMYDKALIVPVDFEQIGRWGIPAIIVINAIAGLVWYMLDQTTGVDRSMRRKAALVSRRQRELSLNEQVLAQRTRQVAQMTRQAAESSRLAAMEKGIGMANEDDSAARAVADATARRVRSKVLQDIGDDGLQGNGHNAPAPVRSLGVDVVALPNAQEPRQ